MPLQQTHSAWDGKCLRSASPQPHSDAAAGELQAACHKQKIPCLTEHMASTTFTPASTQPLPAPLNPNSPSTPTTALPPLPLDSSSYTAVAATSPSSASSHIFPPNLEVTPTPPGGFPIPQLGCSVWKNINHTVRASWTIKSGPKTLVEKIAGQGVATTLHVSMPVAVECLQEKLPPPWHYLISNIPQSLADFLGQQVVVSTPDVMCFFLPFDPLLQMYLCNLENFALPSTTQANNVIAEVVKAMLLCDHEGISFIEEQLENPDTSAVEQAIKSIYASSFTIALSLTKKKTLWNIYCHSPPIYPFQTSSPGLARSDPWNSSQRTMAGVQPRSGTSN
ncbi:hypothetical protein EDD16DRAFT_1705205 [Pisolithus croceorrhizus]|nr:hypothetical protein EV401DRAFT_2075372 [Pisolithus croceorrhizus]KAI6122387.1 hypothetical protein EDD16DRAFT_1705205 [Pisolithus croceorrhizus]KAI6169048.1 hypothetical protein EDD17DRAFT_1749514 [Pisolithus thermaeus]